MPLLERKSEPMETAQYKQTGRTRWPVFLSSRGPQADAVIAESGLSFHLWRLYQHFWLVCLLFPLVHLVRNHLSLAQVITGMSALVFFAVSYTWLMWRHPIERGMRGRSRTHLQLVLWLVLVALALVLSLIWGLSFLWLFVGVSAIAGVLFPLRRAFVVVSLLMVLPPVLSVILNGGITEVDWGATIALTLLVRALGLDMLGLVHLSGAIRELHATRKELARLKVEEERQRLSRDLHDLLGQTLSMIALKSELAQLLAVEDQQRCVQEIAEIERVARRSLREVREAVAGYRQPRLESELEGARQILEAAGIDVQIEALRETLAQPLDTALAWTVREGVTNVIRHSRAQQCWIRLTQREGIVRAEVLNDGGERRPEEKPSRRGLGLAGLRERVSPLGGSLSAGPLVLQGKEHFRLCVELPFQKRREALASQEEDV
jgi:two-component system sensor histidine kinase DesK